MSLQDRFLLTSRWCAEMHKIRKALKSRASMLKQNWKYYRTLRISVKPKLLSINDVLQDSRIARLINKWKFLQGKSVHSTLKEKRVRATTLSRAAQHSPPTSAWHQRRRTLVWKGWAASGSRRTCCSSRCFLQSDSTNLSYGKSHVELEQLNLPR